MLEMMVAKPAETEKATPTVLAPKQNGSIRFCMEYWNSFAVTTRDFYLIPRMDECIYSLWNILVFSSLESYLIRALDKKR